jgi:Fusaric acid resistance protein-like
MNIIQEKKRLQHFDAYNTVFRAMILAISCVASFWLITHILVSVYSISRDDDFLGGMWAVAATIFVYRHSYEESAGAALSRMAATVVSFALCFVYLLILPFHVWGMAGLIAIGAIALAMIGRSDDMITASITTTVVMVVAAIGPQDAWREPILRLVDTALGVSIGLGAAWIYAFGHQSASAPGSRGRE